jgi:hypothetical protein
VLLLPSRHRWLFPAALINCRLRQARSASPVRVTHLALPPSAVRLPCRSVTVGAGLVQPPQCASRMTLAPFSSPSAPRICRAGPGLPTHCTSPISRSPSACRPVSTCRCRAGSAAPVRVAHFALLPLAVPICRRCRAGSAAPVRVAHDLAPFSSPSAPVSPVPAASAAPVDVAQYPATPWLSAVRVAGLPAWLPQSPQWMPCITAPPFVLLTRAVRRDGPWASEGQP